MKRAGNIFRTLLESAAEGIVIVDVEGRIRMVNGTAEAIFGYRQAELLGKPVETLLPESRREAHRAHRAGYLAEPRNRAMGNGLELLGRRKDGSEFPVEIALSHAGEGRRLLVMASVSDITGRKRREEEKNDLMTDRIRELEAALSSLEVVARPPAAAVTARLIGMPPLTEAKGGVFTELLDDYGRIMEEELESRIHRSGKSTDPTLGELAARLGFLKATPRDVVELHGAALREKSTAKPPARLRGYLEEGHFLLVELMGHLVMYYRNRALADREREERSGSATANQGGGDGR